MTKGGAAFRLLVAGALVAALAACATALSGPDANIVLDAPPPGAGPAPLEVRIDPETGERTASLRVMTYNIAGLPAPLKAGRAEAIARIGDSLAEMRAAGTAPHVVLIQEGFMDAPMAELIARAGYAHVARGPDAALPAPARDAGMRGAQRLRGEGLGKALGSGLYILSDFPILETRMAAYGDCAGVDCLANKGAMVAQVALPGAPAPIAVANTHMNAKKKSLAPLARAHLAHRLQVAAMDRLVRDSRRPGQALIFGGDFNMRRSEERWSGSVPPAPYAFARYYCAEIDWRCDASGLSLTEAGLRDTQDLQGFHDGAEMRVRPQRLAILYDKTRPGALSDHSAYLVDYRISWGGAPDETLGPFAVSTVRQAELERPLFASSLTEADPRAPIQSAALADAR